MFFLQTYVQTILKQNSVEVFNCIVKEGGHFYVCGDVKMASDVTATLEKILSTQGDMTMQDAKNFIMKLRVRYFFCFFLGSLLDFVILNLAQLHLSIYSQGERSSTTVTLLLIEW